MKKIPSWKFGDTKKEADYILELALSKKKKATSSLYDSYRRKNVPLPRIGDKNIIQDSNGIERCLIVTTKVRIKPFNQITKAFASKEGERDGSLSHWRKTHRKFFEKRLKRRNIEFNNNILVVCEEFKLLKNIKRQPILSDLFGKYPRKSSRTAQELKDEARKGWR